MLLLVVIACASQENEATGLLQDSKFGLSHLNDEFHTIKGEDLLANPKFGLAHLNDEFHNIKEILAGRSPANGATLATSTLYYLTADSLCRQALFLNGENGESKTPSWVGIPQILPGRLPSFLPKWRKP